MSRKHFQAIADDIRTLLIGSDMFAHVALRRLAHAIADTCAVHNPRFNRARFLTACGFTKSEQAPV